MRVLPAREAVLTGCDGAGTSSDQVVATLVKHDTAKGRGTGVDGTRVNGASANWLSVSVRRPCSG